MPVGRRESPESPPSQASSLPNSNSNRSPLSTSAIIGHFASITSSIQRRLSGGLSNPSSPSSSFEEPVRHFREPDPPLSPLHLHGFKSSTTERILNERLAEEIRLMLPTKHQLHDHWDLVYSLDQHGVSLATLYARSKAFNSPQAGFVIAVKDRQENIFGAYLSDYPHIHPHYYGTGECFLYKFSSFTPYSNLHSSQYSGHTNPSMESRDRPPSAGQSQSSVGASQLSVFSEEIDSTRPSSAHSTDSHFPYQFKGFSYTGLNDYMILCTPQFLSVGGGDGKYGLFLDDVFENGISSRCPAFGNDPLSDSGEKFKIEGVEVWRIGGSGGNVGFVYD